MIYSEKNLNTAILFRALAELSEKYPATESGIELKSNEGELGRYIERPVYIEQLSVSCLFREDPQELWLEVGRLYEKHGGNPEDLLACWEIRKMRGATDVPAAGVQPLQEPAIAEDELSRDEWDIAADAVEKEIDILCGKPVYYARAVIQRKDRKVFENLVDKKIKLAGQLFTIIGGRMTHLASADGSASTSAYVLCKFDGKL
jgi:hypothetical protein